MKGPITISYESAKVIFGLVPREPALFSPATLTAFLELGQAIVNAPDKPKHEPAPPAPPADLIARQGILGPLAPDPEKMGDSYIDEVFAAAGIDPKTARVAGDLSLTNGDRLIVEPGPVAVSGEGKIFDSTDKPALAEPLALDDDWPDEDPDQKHREGR